MNSSYRVRTQIGVDKAVSVDLQQDFEMLEILSMKIYQREIYTRVCSDYGVICGRVYTNNGFGVPNVKISLFIPLSELDADNPEITEIYPYTSLSELDVNGYRYNLLPKVSSHSGHVPTGTFPTRLEILTNRTYSEVYEKYYKFTVKTNESGDYMIFGAPVGSYTIFLDLDLSDIGQFSLSPQDLVRIGLANESQVSGSKFISSNNLNNLPQIISLTKQIEILPLWGNEEICQPSITRTDFDLTAEANIDLTPTAVFMGSIMSTEDEIKIDSNCKVNKKVGNFCNLLTGPGQILAIRHTINYDTDSISQTFGFPQLEEFKLPNDGHVIDENGAWLVELPMNLDYVYTNEFGEQLISTDPTIGVPTKAKYRFKIKWNQSPSLSEETRRAYFLVPNIKEWGWSAPSNEYNTDGNPVFYGQLSTNPNYIEYQNSYAFSLDWNDYGNLNTVEGQEMVQEAINCEDRFFLFEFKKVYTVSQLMDKYKNGNGLKYIGIKNILNNECSSENNKYPVNDGHRGNNILYLLFSYILTILKLLLFPVIVILHAVSIIIYAINLILQILIWGIYAPIYYFVQTLVDVVNLLAPGSPLDNPFNKTPAELSSLVLDKVRLKKVSLPLLLHSEGDCTFCNCSDNEDISDYSDPLASQFLSELGNSCNAPLNDGASFETPSFVENDFLTDYQIVVGGLPSSSANCSVRMPSSAYVSPYSDGGLNFADDVEWLFSHHLTFAERVNISNTKQKYFSNSNVIRTYIEPNLNGDLYHTDNTLIYMIVGCDNTYETGNLITFQDPSISTDPNSQITGTSTSATSVTITYASLTSGVLSVQHTYNLPLLDSSEYITESKYKSDIEYFQVVTAITYNDLVNLGGTSATSIESHSTFYHRLFRSPFVVTKAKNEGDNAKFSGEYLGYVSLNSATFSQISDSKIVILVRGVDPYSPKYNIKYDISRLLNRSFGTVMVEGNYRLNVPVQPGGSTISHKKRSIRHHEILNNNDTDTYGGKLFFPSWFFQPGTNFQPFESELTKYYGSMDVTLVDNFSVLNSPNDLETQLKNFTQVRVDNSNLLCVKMFGNLNCGYYPTGNGGCNVFTAHYNDGSIWKFPTTPDTNTIVNGVTESNGNTWAGSSYILHTNDYTGDSVEGCSLMWQQFREFNDNKWQNSRNVYYSPAYTTTSGITGMYGTNGKTLINDSTNIVFRSDRLPTSTTEKRSANNSMLFFQNKNFSVFTITDDGQVTQATNDFGVDTLEIEETFFADGSTLSGINDQVVASFSDCENAVPFKCYNIDQEGTILIDDFPNCTTGPLNTSYFQNGRGCYSLVTVPVIGIPWDYLRINEWYTRVKNSIFLCMDGIQYDFYNNWVSGNLFMPTINASSTVLDNGIVLRNYCTDIVVYHRETKNYFYRSSPYRYGYGFIGARTRTRNVVSAAQAANIINQVYFQDVIGTIDVVRGNFRNLKTPTTIINLGPVTSFTQELVQGEGYSGYVVNYFTPTSYRDITDIVNLFVISRNLELTYAQSVNIAIAVLTAPLNPTALLTVGSQDPTNSYFGDRLSLEDDKINADLAQVISINSEFGVKPFSPPSYPTSGSVKIIPLWNLFDVPSLSSSIQFLFSSQGQTIGDLLGYKTPAKFIIGIFFENHNDRRDAITPKRIVWNENAQLPFQQNEVTYYTQPSQQVPFYQWNLDYTKRAQFLEIPVLNINIPYPWNDHETIFGSWRNDWYTNPITSSDTFFTSKIQELDRVSNTSRYFRPNSNTAKYSKGYIYNVNENGQPEESLVNITEYKYTVGSPYHFYFGLKKGKSAMDLFYIKYVDTELIIE